MYKTVHFVDLCCRSSKKKVFLVFSGLCDEYPENRDSILWKGPRYSSLLQSVQTDNGVYEARYSAGTISLPRGKEDTSAKVTTHNTSYQG